MPPISPILSETQGTNVRKLAQVGTALALAASLSSCSTQSADEPSGPLDTAELLDLHHAGNLVVAVGTHDPGDDDFDLEGYILSSTDGIHWNERYREPGAILYSVTHGAGRWVAVGWTYIDDERRRSELLTSEDGVNWTPQPALDVEFLSDVVWTGEGFVLAGGRTPLGIVIFTSPDGVDWVETASLPGDLSTTLVAREGTIVTSGEEVSVSRDHGATWSTARGLTPGTWVTELYLQGAEFRGSSRLDCCLGEVSDGIEYYALSSDDGENWTETPLDPLDFAPLGIVETGDATVGFDRDRISYQESDGSWNLAETGPFSDVIVNDSTFVAAGAWTLMWSKDGKVWKDGTLEED